VLGLAAYRLRHELEQRLADDPDYEALLDEVVERRIDPATAARTILERASEEISSGESADRLG
jgi:LAO/AO transport system kinase